jgi:hypothetical protein
LKRMNWSCGQPRNLGAERCDLRSLRQVSDVAAGAMPVAPLFQRKVVNEPTRTCRPREKKRLFGRRVQSIEICPDYLHLPLRLTLEETLGFVRLFYSPYLSLIATTIAVRRDSRAGLRVRGPRRSRQTFGSRPHPRVSISPIGTTRTWPICRQD